MAISLTHIAKARPYGMLLYKGCARFDLG